MMRQLTLLFPLPALSHPFPEDAVLAGIFNIETLVDEYPVVGTVAEFALELLGVFGGCRITLFTFLTLLTILTFDSLSNRQPKIIPIVARFSSPPVVMDPLR